MSLSECFNEMVVMTRNDEPNCQYDKLALWIETLYCHCPKEELLKDLKLFLSKGTKKIHFHDSITNFFEVLTIRDYLKNCKNFIHFMESGIEGRFSLCCDNIFKEDGEYDVIETDHMDAYIRGFCSQCKWRMVCIECHICPACVSDKDVISPYVFIDQTLNHRYLFLKSCIANAMTTDVYKSLKIKTISKSQLEYEVQVVLRGFNSNELRFPNGPNNLTWGGGGGVQNIKDNVESVCLCKELTYLLKNNNGLQRLEGLCVMGNYVALTINYNITLVDSLYPVTLYEDKGTKRKKDISYADLLKILHGQREGSTKIKKLKHLNNSLEIDYYNYGEMSQFGQIQKDSIFVKVTHQQFYFSPHYIFLTPPILINCHKNKIFLLRYIENKYNTFSCSSSPPKHLNSYKLHHLLLTNIIKLKFDNDGDENILIRDNIKQLMTIIEN